MSIVSKPNTFSASTTISSSAVNANFDTIYNDYNGGISAANLATDSVTTAKIAAANVTAAKIADGAISTAAKISDGVVTTAKLAAASVTADKLGTGAASATVATSQTRATASYGDLATVGPAVTVTVGANGLLWVSLYCTSSNSVNGNRNKMSYTMTGANTASASDARAFITATDNAQAGSFSILLTGLTPGSTTLTAQYNTSSGTGTYSSRGIQALPL